MNLDKMQKDLVQLRKKEQSSKTVDSYFHLVLIDNIKQRKL